MQPRDLIRYVLSPRSSLSAAESITHSKSPVSRSIRFLNFLSDWCVPSHCRTRRSHTANRVASLILVQPRSKNRMRLFERFIAIADSLRRDMENFDALMGVLAGMNSQPVFRLTEDLEPLKSRDEYKRFRSLNRLMSNNKSFAAYRMALSSSGPAALPYLLVHFFGCKAALTDLLSAQWLPLAGHHQGERGQGRQPERARELDQVLAAGQIRLGGRGLHEACANIEEQRANRATHRGCPGPLVGGRSVLRYRNQRQLMPSLPDTLYQLSYSYKPRSGKAYSQSHKLRRFIDHMLMPQANDATPKPSRTYHPE
jgi:hypothetical protein